MMEYPRTSTIDRDKLGKYPVLDLSDDKRRKSFVEEHKPEFVRIQDNSPEPVVCILSKDEHARYSETGDDVQISTKRIPGLDRGTMETSIEDDGLSLTNFELQAADCNTRLQLRTYRLKTKQILSG